MRKLLIALCACAAMFPAIAHAESKTDTAVTNKQGVAYSLFKAYRRFHYVQYCYKDREGYAYVYISDPEYRRAQVAVEAIKQEAVDSDSTLDTNRVWERANEMNQGKDIRGDWCQRAFHELLEMSPAGGMVLEQP